MWPPPGPHGEASDTEIFLVNEWFDNQEDPLFDSLLIQHRRGLLNLKPLERTWEVLLEPI